RVGGRDDLAAVLLHPLLDALDDIGGGSGPARRRSRRFWRRNRAPPRGGGFRAGAGGARPHVLSRAPPTAPPPLPRSRAPSLVLFAVGRGRAAPPFIDQSELVVADQHHVRHAEEQPGIDDAGNGLDAGVHFGRRLDRPRAAVQDVVAVVREERLAVRLVEHRL